MGYGHLNIDEREVILKMRAQQISMRHIGDYLGRNVGTISRELSRNVSSTGEYKPHLAQRYYWQRRADSKQPYRFEKDNELRRSIRSKLKRYWSPEQISSHSRIYEQIYVSPATIYSWIYRNRTAGGTLWKYLRQSHRRRRKRYGSQEHRGQIPDRRMIDKRPKIVNQRKRIGDWESDTFEGKKSTALLSTHVERVSRYTIAVKLNDKSSETVNRMILKSMQKLPSEKIKTMTFDNGREFAGFKELERGLGMRSYFAHPYHSWERGTNENTNGLLRQFFPKGFDFDRISQTDVDKAVRLLNNRPRKCLNYRTPAEVFWSKPACCASD